MGSHRIRRDGGVIIYIRKDVSYKILSTVSDAMCSMVAVHLTDLNLIVFMVYRPPPSYKSKYQGEVLEKSFKNIVINNIYSEIMTPPPRQILYLQETLIFQRHIGVLE